MIFVTRELMNLLTYFLTNLSIKNGGYAFLIRLDLMLSMSLWKQFQLLQTLNDLSVKHLMKLILYKNDLKLLKFKGGLVKVYLWCLNGEILINCTWNEYIKESDGMVDLFFIINLMLAYLIFKKSKKSNESCSF